MKKTVLFAMLLAATAARAFDFWLEVAPGQTIYFTIIGGTQSVQVVNPNWDSHTAPSGLLVIPATVTDGSNNYNVTAIDNNAFSGCSALTGVVIPEGVVSIGRMAFAACTALDSISLPSTLTAIGSMAFTGTAFFSNNSHINDQGLLIADAYIIGSRRSISGTVTVPAEVQGLGDMAFYSCDNINRIILPEGLRFIGQNAFQDCQSLDTAEMLGTTPPALASNAFSNIPDLAVLVPCPSAETYRTTEGWSSLTIVEHCPMGIAASEIPTFKVIASEGGIVITTRDRQHFTVSNIDGLRVAESDGGFVVLPSHGIYIVSAPGMNAVKVVY